MYELHLKGKTIVELKKAVEDAAAELNGFTGTTVNVRVEKTVYAAKDSVGPAEIDNTVTEADEEYVDESQIGASLHTSQGVHAGLEVDSEGIAWDKRIHSSSKEKVANGSWRLRRGVDKDLVNKIKIELRGAASGSFDQSTITPPISHVEVPAAQPVYVAPHIVEQPPVAPPVQQAPVQTQSMAAPTPPLPTMNSGHTLESFKQGFPLILSQLITEKKITQEYVNILKAHYAVDQIWAVNDAQKEEMFHGFVQYGFIQKVG